MKFNYLCLAAGLCLASSAFAAPPTRYGGSVQIYTSGKLLSWTPDTLKTPADASLQGAVYEGLFTRGREGKVWPQLARPLQESAHTKVQIELNPESFWQNGKPLRSAQVVAWFERLLQQNHRASYVLLPLKGVHRRLQGDERSRVGLRALDDHRLLFELQHPYPYFPRLLASPHARIGYLGQPLPTGTGPFRVVNHGPKQVRLAANIFHRQGRPLLDELVFKYSDSRFSVSAQANKNQVGVLFGSSSPRLEAVNSRDNYLLFLSVGQQEATISPQLQEILHQAINRRRLARRFLPRGAKPKETIFAEQTRPSSGRAGSTSKALTLLMARQLPGGRRLAERLQLDLLRAGLKVELKRVGPEELERYRQHGNYQLLLDTIYLPPSFDLVDQFHHLLRIAASLGRASHFSPQHLLRFANSAPAQRKELVRAWEKSMLQKLGVVVLAQMPAQTSVHPQLMRIRQGAESLDFADTRFKDNLPKTIGSEP